MTGLTFQSTNLKISANGVVYFDQLSGAAPTRKLVKTLLAPGMRASLKSSMFIIFESKV